jgi:NAD(P)H-dependent FMN reductase
MKVAIISGSARQGNNTLRVALAIEKMLENTKVVDFQKYDIPNFNEDFAELGEETSFQQELINAIDNCNLLFVLTPEYNWFPSAEVINMVHQLATSRYIHIFDEKVIATIGVSAGRGGRMPAVQLGYVFNKIIGFFKLNSITNPHTFEAQEVTRCIDAEGNLLDNEAFNAGFKSYVQHSIKVAQRWHHS